MNVAQPVQHCRVQGPRVCEERRNPERAERLRAHGIDANEPLLADSEKAQRLRLHRGEVGADDEAATP